MNHTIVVHLLHIQVIEGYSHLTTMDENVDWMKLTYLLSFFSLNLRASCCTYPFTWKFLTTLMNVHNIIFFCLKNSPLCILCMLNTSNNIPLYTHVSLYVIGRVRPSGHESPCFNKDNFKRSSLDQFGVFDIDYDVKLFIPSDHIIIYYFMLVFFIGWMRGTLVCNNSLSPCIPCWWEGYILYECGGYPCHSQHISLV
jgi:hypothetical protein